MADIRIRKRKRMREKDAKAMSLELSEATGVPVFSENEHVDTAESTDYGLIFAGGDIVGMIYEEKPFLTIRGILKYKPVKRFVTVDMGAVPFISNGADAMGPGITDADPEIKEGDMVWIRDIKNGAPLAVGVALRPADRLMAKESGKAVKTVHYIGDRLWKTGE
ncbi:MAG: PUA domain-containing protein [Candidatus Methanomethylophilaceae archaeon]|jgi:PUA-domain protein